MNVEFNYKKVYLYLLSFFTISFFLSLTDLIDSSIVNVVRNYSIFGIIVCIICWIVIEYFNYEISHTESYHTNIIQDYHSYIIISQAVLIIILFIGFIFYV